MPDLDPTLAAWRAERLAFLAGKTDDELLAIARGLSSPERIATWERYRAIKAYLLSAFGAQSPESKLSIPEVRWALTLLSADRAESVSRSRASSKEAKAASTPAAPKVTLASILANLGG
jgi:hypothetical protein